MKNITRGILLLVMAISLRLAPTVQAGDDKYAAIAVNTSTGKGGYGRGFDSEEAAVARARKECGAQDSEAFWCKNAWIALAISDRKPGGFGWAWSESKSEARSKALANCKKFNGDGRVTICVSAFGD
ncbi:MAG TPA: DUF4189 domain-containing protein [Chthoniobacterales bacterium]|jgi:hypothetical protein|nr:DUF4189 domain-containing protein [Chthoniobacterales bacterium]